MAWAPTDADELARLYSAGVGSTRLSRRYGVSVPAVLAALRDLGVPVRAQKSRAPQDRRLPDGRFLMSNGYVRLPREASNGNLLEHRVLMEQMLGRPLRRGESVHHRNGIRHDNRPSNLELRISTHPPGSSIEEIVAWAREALATYEPMLERGDYKPAEHPH